jgi:predicted GNAT superfamily acetyltransferase
LTLSKYTNIFDGIKALIFNTHFPGLREKEKGRNQSFNIKATQDSISISG